MDRTKAELGRKRSGTVGWIRERAEFLTTTNTGPGNAKQEHQAFFAFLRARILFPLSETLALPRWSAEQDYFFALFLASEGEREAGVPSSVSSTLRPLGVRLCSPEKSEKIKPALYTSWYVFVFPKRVMS